MRKMSMGVAALFVVGLAGLACSDQSGLNAPGGGNGDKGGQAVGAGEGGTTGTTGGTIGTGGVTVGASGGTPTTGGATGTGGTAPTGGTPMTGGTGGTSGCPLIACPAIGCLYGYLPNPEPCGCPTCAPPDAGVAKDAGGEDGRLCLALPCAMPICPGGGYVSSPDPCGCPICATDGGTATDAGKKDAPKICPLINCPMLACVGESQPNPDPCGCPICVPPDAGMAKDASRADAPPICLPVACPAIACVGGMHPNPDPCGCPLCGPAPDAGVAKDATPPTACPTLESLNSTDAAQIGYSAKRMLLECTGSGITETCVANDATACPGSGSAVGDSAVCRNLCAENEYGLSYGGVGPLAPPPSIALPAACKLGLPTPGGTAFYCCPCVSIH